MCCDVMQDACVVPTCPIRAPFGSGIPFAYWQRSVCAHRYSIYVPSVCALGPHLVAAPAADIGRLQVEVGPAAVDGDEVVGRVRLGDDATRLTQLVDVNCGDTWDFSGL